MTDRERLIQFLNDRQMTYRDLGRKMKWSPTFIYGVLGGAWPVTNSFRWAFEATFGPDVMQAIFGDDSHTLPSPDDKVPA